jgi:hypothetical protein
VGGIFCNLEKVFVDHGIHLSELNFYGINGKDHVLYQSYLDNRYCRTAICNDSNNSNIKFQVGPKLDLESHKAVLGPLLFILHINDLPKT